MRHALGVEEVESGGDLLDDEARLLLGEVAASLDVVEQRAALHLLEDHVEFGLLLEELDDLEYVRAVATVQVDLDLLEDALAVRVTRLVDDLDRVLGTRVDVATRPHLAVGALTEHLARHRVHVREAARLHVGRKASLLLARHAAAAAVAAAHRGRCCFAARRSARCC